MPTPVDVFIIGGGPAGQKIAHALAAEKYRVGIAEYRGFGGTCALRGCDPKRILVTLSEAVDGVDRLMGHGLAGEARLDWKQAKQRVQEIIGPIPKRAHDSLTEAGIQVYEQRASFVDKHTLQLGNEQIRAEKIVIATGKRPAPLGIPGEAFAKTSDDFHHLDEIPERVLFVGGGYIGLEAAHICCRAGAEVIIINSDDDPLPMFETDLVDRLIETTRDMGVDFVMNAEATAIEQHAGAYRVSVKSKDGTEKTYVADLVMNTAGRVPNLEDLNLGAAGIAPTEQGIAVDDYMRIDGAAHLYAVGDIADNGAPPLTPVASLEAKALIATLQGKLTRPDYTGLPTAVYTLPELAGVGLTEQEALGAGHEVRITQQLDAGDQFNAKRSRVRAYGYKTVVDAKTNRLLGACILGPDASEIINLFALAIRSGMDVKFLQETPYAYPTWGSDVSGMV